MCFEAGEGGIHARPRKRVGVDGAEGPGPAELGEVESAPSDFCVAVLKEEALGIGAVGVLHAQQRLVRRSFVRHHAH